ncbi:MAG: Uma2 family endonuclease [Planctomycetota bacterium]
MVEAGILPHDYRFELIDGELVPMSPKSSQHFAVQTALLRAWGRSLPDTQALGAEPTLRTDGSTFVEPDLHVWPSAIAAADITLASSSLVIEIAVTSLKFDLTTKAELYSRHGVTEYWVIDTVNRVTRVHREPTETGFGAITQVAWSDRLVPTRVPELAIRLDDHGLNLG